MKGGGIMKAQLDMLSTIVDSLQNELNCISISDISSDDMLHLVNTEMHLIKCDSLLKYMKDLIAVMEMDIFHYHLD